MHRSWSATAAVHSHGCNPTVVAARPQPVGMTRQKKQPVPRHRTTATAPSARGAAGATLSSGRTRGAPARVTATSPGDLLGLVPYLLGFPPEESLVLMLIRDRSVLLTARLDLPAVDEAPAALGQLVALASQHEASGLVVFAYSQRRRDARGLLERLVPGLRSYGLLDALYVGPDRWWSLTCTAGCCPEEGTAYDLTSHRMAAEAVYAGLAVAGSRSEVAGLAAGPPAGDHPPLTELARVVATDIAPLTVPQRCRLVVAEVQGWLAAPRRLDDAECLRLAVLVTDLTTRDSAWALMTRDDINDHVDLWSQVVARAVPPLQPGPLCLLGVAAWIAGNGALQNCCSERARQLDPDYSMAALLDDINAGALSPSVWDGLATDMRRELAAKLRAGASVPTAAGGA